MGGSNFSMPMGTKRMKSAANLKSRTRSDGSALNYIGSVGNT